jgi:hypothetical protein
VEEAGDLDKDRNSEKGMRKLNGSFSESDFQGKQRDVTSTNGDLVIGTGWAEKMKTWREETWGHQPQRPRQKDMQSSMWCSLLCGERTCHGFSGLRRRTLGQLQDHRKEKKTLIQSKLYHYLLYCFLFFNNFTYPMSYY